MLRLSQVAKLLQQPVSKVTNDLVIKGNGRHLIVYNQEVYSFPSTKNVIIPFDLAAKYAKISHQKKIHPPPQLSDLLKPLDKTEVGKTKHSIAVLLGHFNHGKTTLLDTLINYTNSSKNSDLVSEEKHGITQEVRTKSIQIADDHYLTLIDTPGQEIFYRMRNHGAAVADMGLLLISMADGICRQTEESIGILESLRIPVVVCLNKLDLLPQKTEEERQERIRQFIEECKVFKALDSPSATFVPISAKNSIHIDKLIQEIERVSSIVKSSGKRIKGIKHEYLTGKGYVLNIIHDRYSGQTLHIVMTAGSMKVGDYFVAGGWSGRVKLIVTTNDDELLRVSSNSSTTGDNDENLIRKGIAVKLTASFHPDIGNPRPLGDDIYFFSGRNLPDLTTNKDMKKLQDKLKEETEYFMDQNFMFESFESHHLSEEERDRLKINNALLNQKGLTPFYKHVLSLQPSLKEDESSEEEVESNDSEDDDIPLPPKGLVIIKASSDIEISTIHDVYEDELNAAAKIPSSQEGKQKKFGPKKIIFSGVGQLSFKDTELARLGQATLLCYNVGIDKLALQNLKSHSLKVVHFERVQDVLDYLFDRKTVDA